MPEVDALGAFADDLSTLPTRHRLAVEFADWLMTRPGDMPDSLVAALRGEFSADQLVELTLKVLKFNQQKVTVVTGHDVWFDADLLAASGLGRSGDFTVGPG